MAVAVTVIGHSHSMFPRGVPGGLPVIMAKTWTNLPGTGRAYRYYPWSLSVFPGSSLQLTGGHSAKLELSTRVPAAATVIGHSHSLFSGECRQAAGAHGAELKLSVRYRGYRY